MFSDFSTTLSAKWILAGEHAVVRQCPAIIYPLPHYQFSLAYEAQNTPWQLTVHGQHHSEIQALFFKTLEHALFLNNATSIDKKGTFHLKNNIPLGSGLGASAAFCFAIAQWLTKQGIIDSSLIYQQGKALEDLFHGKSSGIDIVGTGANSGRYFHKGEHVQVNQTWQPYWYLSSSGSICKTDQCVAQVNELWQINPKKASLIDEQMTQSVHLALSALKDTEQGIHQLIEAITLANMCFKQWGLIHSNLEHHMEALTKAGALACKPTGSGGGGYVVSLWAQPAPTLDWPMLPLQLSAFQAETELTKESIIYD